MRLAFSLLGIVVATLLTVAMLFTPGWVRPPIISTQTGYRGTGQEQLISAQNKRILEAIADRLGIPHDKVMLTLQKYGNTTAATIPLCLWEYESKLKEGDKLVFAAFGGGFTWGSAFIEWAYDGAEAAKHIGKSRPLSQVPAE